MDPALKAAAAAICGVRLPIPEAKGGEGLPTGLLLLLSAQERVKEGIPFGESVAAVPVAESLGDGPLLIVGGLGYGRTSFTGLLCRRSPLG